MTAPVYGLSEMVDRTILITHFVSHDIDMLEYDELHLGDGSIMPIGSKKLRTQLRQFDLPVRVTVRRTAVMIGSVSNVVYYFEKA